MNIGNYVALAQNESLRKSLINQLERYMRENPQAANQSYVLENWNYLNSVAFKNSPSSAAYQASNSPVISDKNITVKLNSQVSGRVINLDLIIENQHSYPIYLRISNPLIINSRQVFKDLAGKTERDQLIDIEKNGRTVIQYNFELDAAALLQKKSFHCLINNKVIAIPLK